MTRGQHHLREWRESLSYSQAEAAVALGVDQTTISCWERGDRTPGLRLAIAIRKVTGIPVESWSQIMKEPKR
jgi:DNA-binding XRE family transcriptional regulator